MSGTSEGIWGRLGYPVLAILGYVSASEGIWGRLGFPVLAILGYVWHL
jgi:hypothetical protein